MAKELQIVDTHAHLCDRIFDPDRDEVIRRAQEAGVETIIIVSEKLEDARRNIMLAKKYPCLKPAAGLYPEYADIKETDRTIEFIRDQQRSLYAVGEVGLDFWIAKKDAVKEMQREVFRQFIQLAGELDLPLNVHSRSAGRHAVAMLLENGAVRVQMHAFDGKAAAALPAVEAGFFFSVPPSVIRSRQKQKLLKHLPLSCLLVESDSPVLGPDPEQRNEPANILTSVKVIAEIKDISYQEVFEAVCENTSKLYGDM
jgi:TatD DNase family protein